MAALDQIGTTLIVGGQSTISGAIIESEVTGTAEVAMEDIDDQDGSLETRVIYKRLPTASLSLISKTGFLPKTVFPIGDTTTAAAGSSYSGWYVDDCSVTASKSPERSSIKLTSLGI